MAQIISVPGVKGSFAVGLSWRHEDSNPSSKALRARSIERGRWGYVRKTTSGSIQVCNCEPIPGLASPSKAKILAAIVADHRREPWMGLYELADGLYWYIAVRDGGEVIVDGDKVGTLDELTRLRDRHQKIGPWEAEVLGTLDDLAEILRNTPKQPVLRDLQKRAWIPFAAAAGALALAGSAIGGYWYYDAKQQEIARQAELARQRAIQAAIQAKNDAQSKILPWTQEPMPMDSLAACSAAWHVQPLAKSGWTLAAWSCEITAQEVAVSTEWERTGGLADMAPGAISPDSHQATDTTTFPARFGVPSAQADPVILATRAIWSLAQSKGIDLQLTSEAPAVVLPGSQPKPLPIWAKNTVDFSLTSPPWANGIDVALDAMPGLRVKRVLWKASTQQWAVSANLYALRASPAEFAQKAAQQPPVQPANGGRT